MIIDFTNILCRIYVGVLAKRDQAHDEPVFDFIKNNYEVPTDRINLEFE